MFMDVSFIILHYNRSVTLCKNNIIYRERVLSHSSRNDVHYIEREFHRAVTLYIIYRVGNTIHYRERVPSGCNTVH